MTRSWRRLPEQAATSLAKLEDEALPRSDRRNRDILPQSTVSADVQLRTIGTDEQVERGVGSGTKRALSRGNRNAGNSSAAERLHHVTRAQARAARILSDLGSSGE